MKKILVVAGTRPEIIKLAPIVLHAREMRGESTSVRLCLTGQHQTMAQEALAMFNLRGDASLDIMKQGQTLNDIGQAVFERLPTVLHSEKPDVLMVQGDTTTAAMAALCAFNTRIPVAHVEAGLRSFSLDAPYPEECNRRVISIVSRFNFCPTDTAAGHLRREGAEEATLFVTGNTVVDALRRIGAVHDLGHPERVHPSLRRPYILITAHRRESFGEGFQQICGAIRACAEKFPEHQFVYPVHLNPNVQKPVHDLLGDLPNVLLMPPVAYLPLLTLLKHCEFVLTDSGGIQEEAPSFGKYCIVMRDVTERMESVALGISELVGASHARIVESVTRQIASPPPVLDGTNPYGDGRASERIMSVLAQA